MKYILETKNVTKRYKKQNAVSELSMQVRENSVYGLLGPNGAGKSTLLKMLTTIIEPTSGQILFNGHDITRKDLNDIGLLIEYPPLYHNLTAKENLSVRTTCLGLPERRIDEVLKIVGLEDTGKKRAVNFSLGMKQRLGIAMALLNKPKLLILDEPMNGLDPMGIEDLRNLIKGFPKEGITVIVSSHILSEVEQVADTIGIIYDGELKYQNEVNKGDNLEDLFMNVVKQSRGEKK